MSTDDGVVGHAGVVGGCGQPAVPQAVEVVDPVIAFTSADQPGMVGHSMALLLLLGAGCRGVSTTHAK